MLRLCQRSLADVLKSCRGKVFDRTDTQYVSYLQNLGGQMEGKPDMINDIS